MEPEIEVTLQHFNPFENSSLLGFVEIASDGLRKRFTYSANFNGEFLLLETSRSIHLNELLNVKKTDEEDAHELLHCSTATATAEDGKDLTLIATVWTEINKFCIPIRSFFALFTIDSNLEMKLLKEIQLEDENSSSQVAFSSILPFSNGSDAILKWTLYPNSRPPLVYLLNKNGNTIVKQEADEEEIEKATDGTVIRSSSQDHWQALGFDCGIISVTRFDKHDIPLISKSLKVSGAVSIVQILPNNSNEQEMSVLVSSVIGPATVWTFRHEGDKMTASLIATLHGSQAHDTVCCAALLNDNLMAIGTYAGKILFYRPPLQSHSTYSHIPIQSNLQVLTVYDAKLPILAMQASSPNEITILTNCGIHQLNISLVSDDS
ncbi:hypothetical protein WR25_19531 [Diploscapter pachys]|uniref:Cleavage/polyadenylation specificity factor A subunit N-terminal domain-containing protein n=1 Tax=Diploscapter pachys TaxID=2018661 RepID=A0A2A2M1Z9_9BILA|nr:hypothetical protein WR25_19531 [Diploscapter pachys]